MLVPAILQLVLGGGPPAGKPYLNNPCIEAGSKFAAMPFCNYALGINVRAADAVARLSLEEKIGNLGTDAVAIPSLGLNAYNWWSEATHGISHVRDGPKSSTPTETNFALPITTAGSFNRTLWKATGKQLGVEARAFMNAGNAYSTYWAPVINLVRDPRWGRNVETPGEDPYLTGQYAINFVRGFQNNPADPTHLQASACCKHFVANSMEGTDDGEGNIHNRHEFDAKVTQQDLVDSYMAPFQDCVEQGEVTSLMCSYNSVNGIPACANEWLLKTVARGEWGFDGYITSDCDADANVYTTHNYTKTQAEAVRDIFRAGTDVDCGGFIQRNAQKALDNKTITIDDIDTRLKFLFAMRLRLGHFDPGACIQKKIINSLSLSLSFNCFLSRLRNKHASRFRFSLLLKFNSCRWTAAKDPEVGDLQRLRAEPCPPRNHPGLRAAEELRRDAAVAQVRAPRCHRAEQQPLPRDGDLLRR